ncbi:tetratricopeptide repeat protein [Ferruginibacter sp. SUN106]|uniref:tetratricopeptide repeat protein n=1 Tax=Ferruginibacter sp. SUN106 TaxID=2978348 RepID=UPI003D36DD86
MNTVLKSAASISLLFFCAVSMAQPAKPKLTKPAAAKPAAAKTAPAKKIDYDKLKSEIRSLYRDEKHAEVITKATQYLQKYPNDTTVVFQKAMSHVSLKQYQLGFNMVRKFYPNADSAAKYIAVMSFSVPQEDLLTTGIACADEAITMVATSPYGYFAKAGIYSDGGDHEKALPLMEKMFNTCRDDFEKRSFRHFYAKELAFNKQYDKAINAINDLYISYPKDKEIIYSYAAIYRLNKSYDKAIVKYDELTALFPGEGEYQALKVSALDAWGKPAEACSEIETLVAIDSTYDFMRFRYKCPAYFATPAIAGFKTATWEVNANGAIYDFLVSNPKGNVDTDFEFDWAMSNKDDMKGHIKLTKDAMEKAIAQNNYFGSALKNATLTDKTTVWVSKAVFNDLTKNNSAKMDVGNGEEIFTVVPDGQDNRDKESFEDKVLVKGSAKYVNTLHVKNEDGSRQLWILNDAKNPMIIKMDLDWSIVLKSIE